MTSPQQYSAAQLAKALGREASSVRRSLESVPAAGPGFIAGNEAKLYRLNQLPEEWVRRLEEQRESQGYRSIECLLRASTKAYGGDIVWADLPDWAKSRASELRAWLRPALEAITKHGSRMSAAVRIAIEGWTGSEAQRLGEKQIRRLLADIITKDANRHEFSNLALYVDRRATKPSESPRPAVIRKGIDLEDLERAVAELEDPTNPSLRDRAFLMDAAFRTVERSVSERAPTSERKRVIRSILSWILSAVPSITEPPSNLAALQKRFRRNFEAWVTGGRTVEAIADGRAGNSGRKRPLGIPDTELESLKFAAIRKGSLGTAWTFARHDSSLPALTATYRGQKPPRWIYEELGGPIAAALMHEQGDAAARLRQKGIARDWTSTSPGDHWSIDDKTFDCLVAMPDGNGSWHAICPQLLLICDEKSLYIIGGLLIPDRHYTAAGIRLALLRAHDSPKPGGLPRCGLLLENGTFRSKQVIGSAAPNRSPFPWRETESGLRHPEIGLDIHFCTPRNPRAKRVETALARLRRWFVDMPGYVGTNQRENLPERTRVANHQLKQGIKPRDAGLLTWDEWIETELPRIFTEHNAFSCDGPVHHGAAPAELWDPAIIKRPLRRLPENARHLLASDRQRARVRNGEISIEIGARSWRYVSEATGPLEGRELDVRFNYEAPEFLSVFDKSGTYLATVKALIADAKASSETEKLRLSDARARQSASLKFGRDQHRAAWRDAKWVSPIHRVGSSIADETRVSEQTLAAGEMAGEGLADAVAAQEAEGRVRASAERDVSRLGGVGKSISADRVEAASQLLRMAKSMAKDAHRQKSKESSD
jgi:hypothetical protein